MNLHERIEVRAYYIYLWKQRWGGKDDPLKNWLLAEREEIEEMEQEETDAGITYQEAYNG